ncbi:unnamed protein product [Closterium sp. NIES-53]
MDPQNRHQDGGARRNQNNGANMVADSSDNNPKSNGGAEKKKERTAGQFFHIGEQGEQGDASAKVGAELHPLDYWVLDTGAAWTMTPRKELLDDVRAAPINKVCSASRHALKVAGAGRAVFRGTDGKPVELHDVLLVPDLKANLIALRKLAKAGVSTSTDGARTYKGQLGNRVLWDLHESKDVYRSMWQLPVLAWHGGGQAGDGSASQGECNAVGGVGVKVSARSGETDWATAHRRLGHRDWQEQEAFGAGSHGLGGAAAGARGSDHAASTIKEDWLPFVEKQAECVVKRIRTDRGGEFLGAEMTAWLKKQGIQRELTTAYTPQSNVAHVPKKYRSKLGASAIWCVHLGLAAESKGWLLWEPSKGVLFDSRDVKFVEGMMYGGWKKQPETKVSQQMEQITMQLDLTPSVWEEGEEAAAEAGDGEKVQEAPPSGGDDVETSSSTKEAAGSEGGEQQQGKTKLGRKPPVDMLRVFGYMAVAHVSKKYQSVLFDSTDVKFVEAMMYGSWEKQAEAKVSQEIEQITMQLDLTPHVCEEGEEEAVEDADGDRVRETPARGDDVETSGSAREATGSEGGEEQQGKAKVPELPQWRKLKGVVMRGWETPVSRPGRIIMAIIKLTAGADVAEQQLGNEKALLILPHSYDPDEEDEPAYCSLAPAPEEPASMEEALAGPDREKWLVFRDAGYQSLLENGT